MLDLYVLETCPYCRKVMEYFKENEVAYHKFDVQNADNIQRLMALGGKDQVPFLYNEDTDEKIYESDEIIAYIKNKRQV